MGELIDRDVEHLRLLKIGYYIMAGITGFLTLFSLIYVGLGSLFASGVVPESPGSNGDSRLAGFVFLGVGVFLFLLGALGVTVHFLTARGLRDRRRRVFCLVIAAISCLYIPWGTALGICTFIVLGRGSVKALFAGTASGNMGSQ